MKITAARIENFKRVRDVAITPDADRTVILIGGRNAQGKSSILDALTAAFGGKKSQPVDAVRHGAESATIEIELDGGDLTVRREIQSGGESVLEVRDRFGAVKSPQAMLDQLVGARFLDPLHFLGLPAKEQRAALMRLIDGAERIAGLNEKRSRAFDRRTEVGRDLTKAEGELARLPELKPADPIDIATLTAEARQLDSLNHAVTNARRTHEQCEHETSNARATLATINKRRADLEAELERIKASIIDLGIKSADWAADVETCAAKEAAALANLNEWTAKADASAERRATIMSEVNRAQAHNAQVAADAAKAERRTEVATEVEKLTAERENLTKVIDTIDQRKAEILAAAKLPVDNLGVTDDGIELAGVPFAQASGAEKLRVSLAIAIAASPKLDDVWIRDGALLDEESLELVAKYAEQHGKRVWVERVGTRDPGVIVIHDGQVAS